NEIGRVLEAPPHKRFGLHGGVVAWHCEVYDLEFLRTRFLIKAPLQHFQAAILEWHTPPEQRRVAQSDDAKCAGFFAHAVLVIVKPLRVDEDWLAHESSTNVRPQFVYDARVPARLNNVAEIQTVHRGLRLCTRTPQLHLEGPPILAEVIREPN